MSGRFVRASSYRHTHGEPAKPEKQFTDVRSQCNGDGNYITANELFFAFAFAGGGGPVMVLRHDKPGRVSANAPKVMVHKGAVNDFQFNPFIPTLLATASEDCTAKITQVPEEGLTDNITESLVTLEGHLKKVTLVQFHPTANNILATASYDNTVKVWDVEKQAEVLSYNEFGSMVQSMDWDEQGARMATTSQDKLIRIFDPRAPEAVIKGAGFEGNKASRLVWVNNFDKLAAVGFTKTSTRQYALYDPKKMDKPLVTTDIDQSAGVMMPFYDNDNSILYIAGKGDASIKYFEIVETEPYIHFLSEFRDSNSQKGLCFVPKRAVDVKSCEISRALRLMKDSIVPISFQVPRKSELFQPDLFPDTYAGVPSLEAKEWLAGKNQPPKKCSLKPGSTQSGPKLEFKAQASPAELQAELNKANARIKELEAELAKLKA